MKARSNSDFSSFPLLFTKLVAVKAWSNSDFIAFPCLLSAFLFSAAAAVDFLLHLIIRSGAPRGRIAVASQGSCLSSNDDDFETPGPLSSPSAGFLRYQLCFCHHPDIVIQIRRFFCRLHSLSANLQHYLRAYQTFMLAISSLRPTLRAWYSP